MKSEFELKWERIVTRAYEINEEYDYALAKKLHKDITQFSQNLQTAQKETISTLELTEFNEKQWLKEELINFEAYCQEQLDFIQNFNNLKPTSKKGYYNYLKNMMGYL